MTLRETIEKAMMAELTPEQRAFGVPWRRLVTVAVAAVERERLAERLVWSTTHKFDVANFNEQRERAEAAEAALFYGHQCPKCFFVTNTLNHGDTCPNDGFVLNTTTWKEEAIAAQKAKLAAEAKVAEMREALIYAHEWLEDSGSTITLDHKAGAYSGCSLCAAIAPAKETP